MLANGAEQERSGQRGMGAGVLHNGNESSVDEQMSLLNYSEY
jgi:hypothetical protein